MEMTANKVDNEFIFETHKSRYLYTNNYSNSRLFFIADIHRLYIEYTKNLHILYIEYISNIQEFKNILYYSICAILCDTLSL